MTGMEQAIEQAAHAETYRRYKGDTDAQTGEPVDDWGYTDCQRDAFNAGVEWAVAHLREAGLLAPAPLREVQAENQFGETHTRWATEWELVGRAEGDPMNRQNTVVLARDVEAAAAAGYPRHRWCVVTPRNIKIGPRGMQARYAVAVDLTEDELTEMLVHDSVAPAFLWAGDAEVVRVIAQGDGRAEQ